MPMPESSLERNLSAFVEDLTARPMRIAAHSDMPFAIFRYEPRDEFPLRKHLRLLSYSLPQEHNRRPVFISIARLVWEIVDRFEGVDYLYQTEKLRGFKAAQEHINRLLTSQDFRPLTDELLERMAGLDPDRDVVFLVRAGGIAPFIYRCSALLDGLHRLTTVPVILFYPGGAGAGSDIRFYDLPVEGSLGVYNYRVKVYGGER